MSEQPSKPCARPGCGGRVYMIGRKRARFDRTSYCSPECRIAVARTRQVGARSEPEGVRTKPCERAGCDNLISSEGITLYRWRTQRYCSRECAHADQVKGTVSKPCAREGCETLISGLPSRVRATRYCSNACRGLAQRKDHSDESKPCERAGCDQLIVRGDRPRAEFEKRRYCSRGCANADKVGAAVRRGPVSRRTEQRRRKAAARLARGPRSVFGDVPPDKPWRPAGFAPEPAIPERYRDMPFLPAPAPRKRLDDEEEALAA